MPAAGYLGRIAHVKTAAKYLGYLPIAKCKTALAVYMLPAEREYGKIPQNLALHVVTPRAERDRHTLLALCCLNCWTSTIVLYRTESL